jgi:uncharacterized small protein (DUF1192 family)
VKSQLANLRKQHQALVEKTRPLEAEVSEKDKRIGLLRAEIEKFAGSFSKAFQCSSVEEATEKFLDLTNSLRQAQKESNELRMQIGQLRSLKLEVQESNKKIADLQHNVDFVEARMAYLKQVVMQLVTAPFAQRQKIVAILLDLLSFSAQEKEAILQSPSNGADLSSRLLYAFSPFV